ncbi:hypothetical protein GCM10009765_07060 [Fodinicola feengrottensis]|uniref:CHAP domain-containing protein n=1 Tax=Fodinicola feengrottensis TaxID=435914 RepID=A0ABN2FV26_9ACTN
MRVAVRKLLLVLVLLLAGTVAFTASPAQAATGQDIANLAHAQLGKGCSGNGWVCDAGEWCSDFARWVWGQTPGVRTAGLTADSGSFTSYGRANNIITTTPHVGDAIVYYQGSFAAHVNIVVAVRGDGFVQTIGGNQGSPGLVRFDDWHAPGAYMSGTIVIVTPVGLTGGGTPTAGPGSAQVVIAGMDGLVYHEIRFPDGNWTGFGSLPTHAQDVAVAGLHDGSAQVVIVGNDRVYHEIRYPDGNWRGFQGLPGIGTTETAGAKAAGVAGLPNGSSQVVIIGTDNRVYHEVRFPDGNWSGFNGLPGIGTTEPAGAKAVAITGMSDGSAQVLIVGLDNQVYHEIRFPDGNWSGFAPLGATAKAVSIAGLPGNSAQVAIIDMNDRVYHEIRYANGNWSGLRPVPGIGTTEAAGAKSVGIAGEPDGSSQVVIVGLDNRVYHEVRFSNGNWSGFNGLPGIGTTDAAQATSAAIAGMP